MPDNRNEYFYKTMKDWLNKIEPQIEVVDTYRELSDKLKQSGQLNANPVYIQIMDEDIDPEVSESGRVHAEQGRCEVNVIFGTKVLKDVDSYGKLRKTVHGAIDLIEAAVRNQDNPATYTHVHRGADVYITSISSVEIAGNAKSIDDEQYIGENMVSIVLIYENIYK